MQKLGIVITTFNRPEYLRQCLESVSASVIPEGTLIVIVDDCSTDSETLSLIKEFNHPNADIIRHTNQVNSSVSYSLKFGFNKCFSYGCDVVTNLDSDAIVRPDWIKVLADLKNYFPQQIVSGFHSINKNRNGTERHPIIQRSEKWATKKSVGGINMMMNHALFQSYMEPALNKVIATGQGNWDFICCTTAFNSEKPIAVTIPSVVDHIGFSSAMRHLEEPDVACDFVMSLHRLYLPTVTLIAVEGVSLDKIKMPLQASIKHIDYGAVKLLSPFNDNALPIVSVAPMKSKQEYSRFIFKNLTRFVDTEFVLTIQHDGYVVNHKAWSDDFFQYDYIGAVWNWYGDDSVVGNGGFSLRSKKLLDICATDEVMTEIHPEDHALGRLYRKYLEKHHGIKFAPKEIADRFSIEAHAVPPPGNRYAGSFGFHGRSVDFRDANLEFSPVKNQPIGRGEQKRQTRKIRYTGNSKRVVR